MKNLFKEIGNVNKNARFNKFLLSEMKYLCVKSLKTR